MIGLEFDEPIVACVKATLKKNIHWSYRNPCNQNLASANPDQKEAARFLETSPVW